MDATQSPAPDDGAFSGAEEHLFIHEGARSYISRTELPDGRIGVIVDPGSVWDLAGSEWAKSVAKSAAKRGL